MAWKLSVAYVSITRGPSDHEKSRRVFASALLRLPAEVIERAIHSPEMAGRYPWEVVKHCDDLVRADKIEAQKREAAAERRREFDIQSRRRAEQARGVPEKAERMSEVIARLVKSGKMPAKSARKLGFEVE